MSGLTSKAGPPQITNTMQNSAPPPYIAAAQQNLISTGTNLTSPFTQFAPEYMTAGVNPDQAQAYDLARQSAYSAYSTPTNFAAPGSPTANFVAPMAAQAPAAAQGTYSYAPAAHTDAFSVVPPAAQAQLSQLESAANAGLAAQATPGQLRAGEIPEFLNPYLQNVLDPTLANMRRQNDQTLAQIQAKGAAGSAFGGSRDALMASEQNRNFGDQVATTVGTLMAQGYDKAQATAMANAQMRQQTGLFNAQQANQQAQFNAGEQNKVGMFNSQSANDIAKYNSGQTNSVNEFNSGQYNDAQKYNAGLANTANMFNSGQYNDMSKFNTGQTNATNLYDTGQENDLAKAFGVQFNSLADNEANRNLATAQVNNTLQNDEQRRQLASWQALMQSGDAQRQIEQAGINDPYTALQMLIGATPGMNSVGQTTTGSTAAPTTSNPLATILGAGLLGKTLLSDERSKTDVEKLGKDPDTGVEMAAYRYKGDPKTYPKVVGPASAQQVERVMPGATKNIGGKKVIKGGALQAMIGAG